MYKVRLIEKEKLDLDLELDFDYDSGPSSVSVSPMSNDRTSYFANLKKANLLPLGKYRY